MTLQQTRPAEALATGRRPGGLARRMLDLARRTARARFAALVLEDLEGRPVDTVLSARAPARPEDLLESPWVAPAAAGVPDPAEVAAGLAALATTGTAVVGGTEVHAVEVPLQSAAGGRGRLYLLDRHGGGAFTRSERAAAGDLITRTALDRGDALPPTPDQQREAWLRAALLLGQELLTSEEEDDTRPWSVVADGLLELADACAVTIATVSGPEHRVELAATAEDQAVPRPDALELHPAAATVLETGHAELSRTPLAPEAHPEEWVLALPLRGRSSRHGVLQISRRADRPCFTATEAELAQDFADQVTAALELGEQRAAQHRMQVLAERERIARELHDQVIQRLFATGLRLQSASRLTEDADQRSRIGEAVQELDETVRQIRTSIFSLKSDADLTRTPRRAVLDLVENLATTFGLTPHVRFTGPVDVLVEPGLLDDLEAVIREGVTNTGKHAGATSVEVELSATSRQVELLVQDDGAGLGGSERRSGIANLRSRAEQHGGTLQLERPLGGGLRLRWTVPLG